MTGTPWTTADDNIIKQLGGTGASAKQIADRLSVARSRSAVCGRAFRLGVKLAGASGTTTRKARKPNTTPDPRAKGGNWGAQAKPLPLPVLKEFEAPQAANVNPVSFADLRDGCCKWPVGELYCGAPVTAPRKPYCAAHARVGSQPVAPSSKPRLRHYR